MSFDFTQINEKNCPARWTRVATHIKENDPDQLNQLEENYKDTLDFVYESDFSSSIAAYTNVSVASKSTSEIVFNISSYDNDTPITFDMSKATIAAYPNANSAPTGASTDITLSSGQWTDSAGFNAGDHIKYAFAATDADGVEGPVENIEVILAPAAPTLTGVDGTDSTANVTFTPADGASSSTLYWMAVTGGETAQDIIDGGTAISGYVSGASIATGIGDFGFVMVVSNPGGSDTSDVETLTVTQA